MLYCTCIRITEQREPVLSVAAVRWVKEMTRRLVELIWQECWRLHWVDILARTQHRTAWILSHINTLPVTVLLSLTVSLSYLYTYLSFHLNGAFTVMPISTDVKKNDFYVFYFKIKKACFFNIPNIFY